MGKQISNIVFTKNRPLQLDGYLKSLYRNFKEELIQTYILYKQELFDKQYQQVFSEYPNCVVMEEKDFHSDFLRILDRLDTKYVLFGVDDVVFFDSVDFGTTDEIFESSENIFGFSLRFSREFVEKGGDLINEHNIAGQIVYSIDWTKGQTPTTRYPFELCATIYRSDLVKNIINNVVSSSRMARRLLAPNTFAIWLLDKVGLARKVLKSFGFFYSPNTLESWNCRWCQNQSIELPSLLYFQKQCASAIQVNMVNTSTRELFEGSSGFTVESLNSKFFQGYRLDIDFVSREQPMETHCGKEYFRVKAQQ
jgi:hypothetical protein